MPVCVGAHVRVCVHLSVCEPVIMIIQHLQHADPILHGARGMVKIVQSPLWEALFLMGELKS